VKGLGAVLLAGVVWMALISFVIMELFGALAPYSEGTGELVVWAASGLFFLVILAPPVWRWARGERQGTRSSGCLKRVAIGLLVLVAVAACALVAFGG
jgi:hypothetical protein